MDIERTMQFILDNLAAVSASQQEMAVSHREFDKRLAAQAEKAEARLTRLERQMGGIQKLVKTGMRILVDLGAAQKRTERALAELAAVQKRTDQKFERWLDFMGRTNGRKHAT